MRLNARLDNLQTAAKEIRLDHYDEDMARRREIARRYDEGRYHLLHLCTCHQSQRMTATILMFIRIMN